LDRRAEAVKAVLDPLWQNKEFATFYTFDPRWYNALPARTAKAERELVSAGQH